MNIEKIVERLCAVPAEELASALRDELSDIATECESDIEDAREEYQAVAYAGMHDAVENVCDAVYGAAVAAALGKPGAAQAIVNYIDREYPSAASHAALLAALRPDDYYLGGSL